MYSFKYLEFKYRVVCLSEKLFWKDIKLKILSVFDERTVSAQL